MREDVICQACPDPDTAFKVEDVGVKLTHEDTDGGLRVRLTRPAWEVLMLAHLEAEDDEAHRELFDGCVAALEAEGVTAEEAARREVQGMMVRVTRLRRVSMGNATTEETTRWVR